MDTNKENLRELIEKFMDPRNAQTYLDDIEAAERILRKYPAPKPDDMLLANIKANIALHIIPKKTVTFRKRVFEAIAVAASLIIIAAISLQSFNETPKITPPRVYVGGLPFEGFWTHENPVISELNNVVDEIKSQIVQVAMDSPDYSYDSIPFDQYNNEIQQLEKRLYNVESTQDEYSYNNSILEDIEDLENRFNEFNELNNNFWQDEYSNPDAFEI
jgi:hypothetical protein